jgi:hypothetical protein
MLRTSCFLLSCLFVSTMATAQGQDRDRGGAPGAAPTPVTLTSDHQLQWTRIKGYINGTAKDMPDDMSYKPGSNPRTFGEVWGHMADSRFGFCAAARGLPNPNKVRWQQTVKTKADALKAIAESEAFCDPAFASLTDATFVEVVTPAEGIEVTGMAPIPRGSILSDLIEHDSIQYGYAVVYLRSVVPGPEGRGGTAQRGGGAPPAGRGN